MTRCDTSAELDAQERTEFEHWLQDVYSESGSRQRSRLNNQDKVLEPNSSGGRRGGGGAGSLKADRKSVV